MEDWRNTFFMSLFFPRFVLFRTQLSWENIVKREAEYEWKKKKLKISINNCKRKLFFEDKVNIGKLNDFNENKKNWHQRKGKWRIQRLKEKSKEKKNVNILTEK